MYQIIIENSQKFFTYQCIKKKFKLLVRTLQPKLEFCPITWEEIVKNFFQVSEEGLNTNGFVHSENNQNNSCVSFDLKVHQIYIFHKPLWRNFRDLSNESSFKLFLLNFEKLKGLLIQMYVQRCPPTCIFFVFRKIFRSLWD